MKPSKLLMSLIPWALFTVIAGHGSHELVAYAALAATVVAVGLAVRNGLKKIKIIDITGIVTFGLLTVAGFAGSDAMRDHIAEYGRGGSALVLAAVFLLSIPLVPVTEQFARESVPAQYWGSPLFRAVNRRITALWGGAVLLMSIGHLYSGHLEATGDLSQRQNIVLNWVIPVVLALGALRLTERLVGDDESRSSESAR
jgi:hypothetical protein